MGIEVVPAETSPGRLGIMSNAKQRVLVAAGGAVAAAVLVGTVAFAQTPDSGTGGQAPNTPAPRVERDCPAKDGAPGGEGTGTTGSPRF